MTQQRDNFIKNYLSYIGESEAPTFYHRWSAISMIGAYLGRQYSFSLGHFELYTNMYIMLIGDPGTRKSTAIKIAKKIIREAGYDKISAEKSSKEKFMMDLAGIESEEMGSSKDEYSILSENIFGEQEGSVEPCEMYIACDEFNDFIGLGNIEFISLLGNLWDYNGTFKNRIKSGKSVNITDPTVSILGGNTTVGFASAFPPAILGQGFFSRLLLIHGESTGRKITFPKMPTLEATHNIVSALQQIKIRCRGEAKLTTEASYLLEKIYTHPEPIDDIRFVSYHNRRFTHLLKLCLILSAADYSTTITAAHVVEANTVLTHTEHMMPKALGQFGKARNSDVTHKILSILDAASVPLDIRDIWKLMSQDMEKVGDLADHLRNLMVADKAFSFEGKYLSKKKIIEEVSSDVLDYIYLTNEERLMRK